MDNDSISNNSRPNRVNTAVKLIIVSLIISITRIFLDIFLSAESSWNSTLIAIALILMLFWGLIIYAIYMRKNWARIVYAVIIIVGTLAMIKPKTLTIFNNPVDGIATILNTALQVIAMVLLFQSDSSKWYKKTPQ